MRNNSATCQLYHTNSSEELIYFICFRKFCLLVAMVTKQRYVITKVTTKRVSFVEDHSRNISVKLLSKYLQ